jgi:glycerol-3-phosphate dehydrogenase
MDRIKSLKKIAKKKIWDLVVIGGGSSGLGVAVDSASRGYKTLLIEKYDFSKGTSSRSTKLVHGGVRYLQNGDISLVVEALKERGIMRKNAPHLVRDLSFVIPSYDWWNSPFYGIGLKIYDMMSGKLGLGPSTLLSRDEIIKLIPNVKKRA